MDHEKLNKALKIWQQGPQFNKENYHSSTGFMSNSFIGDFQKCEYDAVLRYAIKEKSEFNENFAIGHMVEAYIFEGLDGYHRMIERYGEHALNKKLKADLIKDISKGNIKEAVNLKDKKVSELQDICKSYDISIYDKRKPKEFCYKSLELAKSVTRHEQLVNLFRSEGSIYHETLQFKLHGMDWRGEVDYLNLNKLSEIDLKTTKSNFKDKSWNETTRQKENFIEAFNYHRQRAVYQIGIREKYDVVVVPRILAVSKTTKSVRLFKFDDQDRLDYEIQQLIPITDRIKEVISGEDAPSQCEVCANCVESENVMNEILVSKF